MYSLFIYLIKGKNKALLIDTGATEGGMMFPLYDIVSNLLQGSDENKNPLPLTAAHTHSHSDHCTGDKQFEGKTSVSVVGLEMEINFFNIDKWPDGSANLNLGKRTIHFILAAFMFGTGCHLNKVS